MVSLAYGMTWSSVDRDELVFLWPALVHQLAKGDGCGAHEILVPLHRRLRGDQPPQAVAGKPPSPQDAMLAAIHCGIHPAYAAPELAHLHEPLMAGAWLGQLVAGRDAWLPLAIAEPLRALLNAAESATSGAPDPIATQLAAFAVAAGGTRRLSRIAHAVASSGRPRLVRSSTGQIRARNLGV